MNRIYYVRAFVWEYNQASSRYGYFDIFQIGTDVLNMKDKLERENWLLKFDYKKIKEISNNENHIDYIKDALVRIN